MGEKTNIFATHLSNLALLDTWINVLGGSHCKCTCFHILCDNALCWPWEKWCITFTDQIQNNQNQVLIDWYCYVKQSNPTNDKKKKLFLIPYEWSEPDVAFVEPLQNSTTSEWVWETETSNAGKDKYI